MTKHFLMHALIKFPLLVLVNLLSLAVVSPAHSLAETPNWSKTPGSMTRFQSVAVNVSDPLPLDRSNIVDDSIVAARIRADLWMSLRGIQSEQQVASIGGRVLSISSVQVATILTAVSADETTSEGALSALQQQLSSEIEDIEIEVSLLEPSVDNLAAAVSSVNELIVSLNSAQLAVVIESPTFIALLRTLGAANKSLEEPFVEMTSSENDEVRIPQLRLM